MMVGLDLLFTAVANGHTGCLTSLLAAQSVSLFGRIAFAGVFALLIIWLCVVPSSRLTDEDTTAPWWKRARIWAIAIAAVQMLIYLLWT